QGMAAGVCSTPESAGPMATMLPTSTPGSAELLHQVDVVIPVRIARRAPAFGVAEPGVETRCLERVGAQRDPIAATAPDLGLGGGQQPGPQARTALVFSHPEQLDITAPAPRPPVQARASVTPHL